MAVGTRIIDTMYVASFKASVAAQRRDRDVSTCMHVHQNILSLILGEN